MKPSFRTLIFTVVICISATFKPSEPGEIQFKFIGNCGLHMTDGKTNFYLDFPYKSGAYGYMEFDDAELDSIHENSFFIFTHRHNDHYSKKNLKKVLKEKGGKSYGVTNISKIESLSEVVEGFKIEALKTPHAFYGFPFRHYSFLITWHGKKIYISGDTTEPETIGQMEDIDLAFIPYWILNNARNQKIEIEASQFAIYHLYPSQMPGAVKRFKKFGHITPLVERGQRIAIRYEK